MKREKSPVFYGGDVSSSEGHENNGEVSSRLLEVIEGAFFLNLKSQQFYGGDVSFPARWQ